MKQRRKGNKLLAITHISCWQKKSRNTYFFFVTVLLNISIASGIYAQDTISVTYDTHPLADDANNIIQNVSHLDDFYESLYHLKNANDRIVSIIHIGDSHIQADYLTHAIRKKFQEQFGNAGRGLIVPARVAGSNDAFNVVSNATTTWKNKRVIHVDQPLSIGIGGITINTDQPNARFNIYMKDLWLDYSFNSLALFFLKDITSFHFSVKDTANHALGFIGPFTDEPFANYSRIIFPHAVGAVSIETMKSSPEQVQATIFGMSLENGRNGILYHAIGVNGAKYAHYQAAMFFARQTAALKPALFIISLGTNESLEFPYLDKNFYQHMDKLVTSLRENNPQAKFILVTPQEVFRKRTRANPGILKVREQIIQYAVENGLAFWDMYKAMGGENSAGAWRGAGLLRTDGIHFSREGYDYQGNLLYHALIKGYNQYVPLRHP